MMSQKPGCRRGSGEDSPPKAVGVVEERCPICLDDFRDKSFISSCFHSFCFACVVRASQVSGNTCPMCKTKFRRVIHNVRANDDYDMYEVPEMSSENRQQVMQDLDEAIRNFRGYRTTMHAGRVPRGVANALATSGGRSGSSSVLVHISLPSGVQHATSRQRGAHGEREFGRNIRRSGRCAPLHVRRAVYSTGVRALPLEAGSRGHKTRIISAAHFKKNPAGTHRLGPWLSREFEVLVGGDQVEFMMQLVLSLIDKVDLESDLFGAHLEPFLSERTSHFMHELISFAKSPFDIIAYDNKVHYDWPADYPVPVGQNSGGAGRNSRTEGFQGSSGQGPSTSLFPDVSESRSSMQQRIFSELVDDGTELGSCRIVEPSSSPIVIHGSDSESDVDTMTFPDGFPGPSSLYSSSKDRAVHHQASKSRQLQASSLPSTSSSVDEISLFVEDDDDLLGTRPEDFSRPPDDGKMVHGGSRKSRKGKLGSSESKFKDSPLELLQEPSHKEERQHSPKSNSRLRTRQSRDCSVEEEEAEREDSYRRRCRRKYEGRNREEESRQEKKHKKKSRNRDSDGKKKHKEKQASRSSEDKHGKRKLVDSYYKRRSRSFSDSEEESHKRVRRHSNRIKTQRHKNSTDEEDSEHNQLQPPEHKRGGLRTDEEQLIQEAKAIDDEIKASKREILKSALKKERIELLQKMSSGDGGSIVGVASSTAESVAEQQVLQNELVQLNEKLVSEKRRLLKVVKHIEEEKAEQA